MIASRRREREKMMMREREEKRIACTREFDEKIMKIEGEIRRCRKERE
jgi:hypothetical protein